MTIKNTDTHYGSAAKWLHWLTALIFLGSYISVYYRDWFTEDKTPENWTALQLHLSIGVTIAVLVTLRVIWRLSNASPALEPGSRIEHLLAHAAHYALYATMIILPITGYLGTGVATEFFFLFDIPKFEDTWMFAALLGDGLGISFEAFEEVMDFIHKELFGETLAVILIVGHILAALYHHYVKKDATLLKMTVSKS